MVCTLLVYSAGLTIVIIQILQEDPLNFENHYLKRITFELAERTLASYTMSFEDGKVYSEILVAYSLN